MNFSNNEKISVVEGMKKSGIGYVRLGNSGLQVSRICLGMMSYGSKKLREWVLEEEEARPFIKRALELGINFFDTANVYSLGISEEITGRALNDMAIREEIVVATKVHGKMGDGPNCRGLSRKHIFDACNASLKRLNMDYIDLYQIHRFSKDTPIEETMEALNDLVRSGKVRYIGASSMCAWQFAKAQYIAEKNGWTKFISMQNCYNLVYREEEREMNPLCFDQGVGLIPYSPLARGFLSGTRTKADIFGENLEETSLTHRAKFDAVRNRTQFVDNDFEIVERLKIIAENKQVKPAQIALAWLLSKSGVTSPIIGASKLYQLEEAVQATSIQLSNEDITSLEQLYQPHKLRAYNLQ